MKVLFMKVLVDRCVIKLLADVIDIWRDEFQKINKWRMVQPGKTSTTKGGRRL